MTKREVKISAEFKAQTTKAILSIILFIFSYVLMLVLSIFLTAACVFIGIVLIYAFPSIITFVLGIGLASLGLIVLFFLIKFIFKSHKFDRSYIIEITQNDEPELFKLINEIVVLTGTMFPKKVYLSNDVNAAVFYDSNFWSMFLPIKKNLQIGLGLVNTISKSELAAILSHEFGHFSQKTMKLGSYVYNVNQVIFNLLYENESYDRLIQKWANISSYLSIFVFFAVKIIGGVQWFLRKIFEVVNKNYLGLSREMEFHADEIAASITGFEPLKTAILRISLADLAYNSVLSFYDSRISNNQKSQNFYKDQLFVMNFLAEDSNILIENSLPQINPESSNRFNKSKLVIKDQWASHPSIEDRVKMLEKTGFLYENIDHTPANSIFSNIEQTQNELSDAMFKDVQYPSQAMFITFEEFQKQYKKEFSDNYFDKIYNGYYDNKKPIQFNINALQKTGELLKIDELFSDEKIDSVYNSIAVQNDIETLQQISDKNIQLKTFDYDGKKYKQKDCGSLIIDLEKELKNINELIKQNDIEIFRFCKHYEKKENGASQLVEFYNDFFEYDNAFENKYEPFIKLSNELQFINFTTPFDQIHANLQSIEPIEAELKENIKKLMNDRNFQSEITATMKDNFELYLSKQWKYFENEKYYEDNLEIIFTAMNNYEFLLTRGYLILKKRLIDYQGEIVKETQENS